MAKNDDKLGVGGWIFTGILGVGALVAIPVFGAVWLVSKGLEKLGVDMSSGEFDPWVDDNMR